MKLSRKNLLIIGGLIVAALVVTGGIPILLTITVNTDGVSYDYRGLEGGSSDNPGGDLLDAPAYVTSWTGDGMSEKIVIEGAWYSDDWVIPNFEEYWYIVTLTVDNPSVLINGVAGTTWTSQRFSVPTWAVYSWYSMQAIELQITNPCAGKVHAEVWCRVMDLNPWSSDDSILASDEGYLRSGVGKVVCTADVVEEGTQAKIYVETGYSHSSISTVPDSEEGWFLQIFNLDTGVKLYSTTVSDNYAGYKYWLVPDGSYSSTATNKMKVILRNELLNQDDDDLFVVGTGMIDDIPEKPTFEIVAGDTPFNPGESITVKVSAVKTVYDIAGFWVSVSYETSAGTTTEYVIQDRWYAATKTTDGGYCQVSFTFPSTGYVRMEASAADVMNLNSGNSEMTWTVYDEEDTGGGDDELGDVDWTTIFMVIALVGAAIFIYLKAPLPPMIKWILVLGLLALAMYFGYSLIESLEPEA